VTARPACDRVLYNDIEKVFSKITYHLDPHHRQDALIGLSISSRKILAGLFHNTNAFEFVTVIDDAVYILNAFGMGLMTGDVASLRNINFDVCFVVSSRSVSVIFRL